MAEASWPLTEVKTNFTTDDYTVGLISALPKELTASRNMLDELHAPPHGIDDKDENNYVFGRISGHNVVMTCQSEMGIAAATILATSMKMSFKKLRFGLLVGIAGGMGIPSEQWRAKTSVFLGDVVISKRSGNDGGVVFWDRGRQTQNGLESQPYLQGVPRILNNAFSKLQSLHDDQENQIEKIISEAGSRNKRFQNLVKRPEIDTLFHEKYKHKGDEGNHCVNCDKGKIIRDRSETPSSQSRVHFGSIASGNKVVLDSATRAAILKKHPNVLAIEMEAAGTMDVFGCATIRGICDYADSHKNDDWQWYAAAAAAAVAKEVLGLIVPSKAVDVPLPAPS
jgi:nucleoside phosphorylase